MQIPPSSAPAADPPPDRYVVRLGGNVDEDELVDEIGLAGRGLNSSMFLLNLSALYGIGAARRDCVARVKGVLGGV
jgi:hypothetical protein